MMTFWTFHNDIFLDSVTRANAKNVLFQDKTFCDFTWDNLRFTESMAVFVKFLATAIKPLISSSQDLDCKSSSGNISEAAESENWGDFGIVSRLMEP